MKILVILPRSNRSMFVYDKNDAEIQRNYLMPMGLPYITAFLKQAGYDVTVINMHHEPGTIHDIIHKKLTEQHYDIIFTGAVSLFYHNMKDLVRYIREASPSSMIVVGGGLVSGRPKVMMDLLKPDVIVIYEGEYTALDLAWSVENGMDVSYIDGICYFKDGVPTLTKPRVPIANLDELPFPDYDAFGYVEYLKYIRPTYIAWDAFNDARPYPILATRGCPFMCTFCFHTVGPKYRSRSIKNIMDEVRYAIDKYKTNVFVFYDELFAYDKERALEFCREFKKIANTVPWKITMMLNLRVDCADDEILDAVKDAGCNVVGLGLESMSQPILDSMGKHFTSDQIRTTLKKIADRDLIVQGSWVFGDPAETLETAKETLEYVAGNNHLIRNGPYLAFVMVFPGSPLYTHCLKTGIIKDEVDFIENKALISYDWHTPMNCTNLSDAEFERLKEQVFKTDFLTKYYAVPFKVENLVNGVGDVHIICPFCKRANLFKNTNYPSHTSSVGCRYCNGRFFPTNRWFAVVRVLVKLFGFLPIYKIRRLL